MIIRSVENFVDEWGSEKITTDKGVYVIDNRRKSLIKGNIYNGYPRDDNQNIIKNEELKREIMNELLKYYKTKEIKNK